MVGGILISAITCQIIMSTCQIFLLTCHAVIYVDFQIIISTGQKNIIIYITLAEISFFLYRVKMPLADIYSSV